AEGPSLLRLRPRAALRLLAGPEGVGPRRPHRPRGARLPAARPLRPARPGHLPRGLRHELQLLPYDLRAGRPARPPHAPDGRARPGPPALVAAAVSRGSAPRD